MIPKLTARNLYRHRKANQKATSSKQASSNIKHAVCPGCWRYWPVGIRVGLWELAPDLNWGQQYKTTGDKQHRSLVCKRAIGRAASAWGVLGAAPPLLRALASPWGDPVPARSQKGEGAPCEVDGPYHENVHDGKAALARR